MSNSKPKRPRPPVVKTDWVVEGTYDCGSQQEPQVFTTKHEAVKEAKKWDDAEVFRRTWRKVDL